MIVYTGCTVGDASAEGDVLVCLNEPSALQVDALALAAIGLYKQDQIQIVVVEE